MEVEEESWSELSQNVVVLLRPEDRLDVAFLRAQVKLSQLGPAAVLIVGLDDLFESNLVFLQFHRSYWRRM